MPETYADAPYGNDDVLHEIVSVTAPLLSFTSTLPSDLITPKPMTDLTLYF